MIVLTKAFQHWTETFPVINTLINFEKEDDGTFTAHWLNCEVIPSSNAAPPVPIWNRWRLRWKDAEQVFYDP